MRFPVTYFLASFTVILTQNFMIIPVTTQCTLHNCDNVDLTANIVTEIQQTFVEAIRQQLSEHDQRIHETLNSSFQQMTNQHTSVLRRLHEVMELLLDHDIFVKNQSQNLCTPTIGSTLQPKTVTDLENDSTLLPNSTLLPHSTIFFHCTLLPTSNNWTIIMNRCDGSLDFQRDWADYKNGFGDVGRGEFWLGNEEVHRLTTRSGFVYSLRVEVQLDTSGRWFNADYSTFSLDSEASKYAIHLSGYSGNAGDSMTNASVVPVNYHHNGMSFATYDAENDRGSTKCAQTFGGGWWFNHCYHSCLTCTYSGNAFVWSFTGGWQTSGKLRAARMMIKSN